MRKTVGNGGLRCVVYESERAWLEELSLFALDTETGEPSDECPTFVCSACGSDMMYGDGGWFDLEPPHKARFGYCPYCGAKVVQKEVG